MSQRRLPPTRVIKIFGSNACDIFIRTVDLATTQFERPPQAAEDIAAML